MSDAVRVGELLAHDLAFADEFGGKAFSPE